MVGSASTHNYAATPPQIQINRHGLSRKTFHGQRGEVRKRYREGQEDQLGALGLVANSGLRPLRDPLEPEEYEFLSNGLGESQLWPVRR
jgi:hypothetical protein